MQIDDSSIRKLLTHDFTNTVIRIGLIAFLVVMCVRVFDLGGGGGLFVLGNHVLLP